MVSAKCDCGESAVSAGTTATEKPADVIADDPARPAVPLVMTATRAPAEAAAIAARSAASPPPRISTSVSSCLIPTDTHRSLAEPVSWARASREMNRYRHCVQPRVLPQYLDPRSNLRDGSVTVSMERG